MPLTPDATRRIAEKYTDALAFALRLEDYSIHTLHGRIENSTAEARMQNNRYYMEVNIEIDPERHGDEFDVADSLLHELLHVLHEPFDRVFESAVTHASDAHAEVALEDRYDEACERFVAHLERILHNGTGGNAVSLCRLAQRVARHERRAPWTDATFSTLSARHNTSAP